MLLFASGLAFYALVSLVPLCIIVLWIVAAVLGDARVQRFAEELKRVAPEGLALDQALERVAELGTQLGIPAVAAALWPATAYGAGLARALQRLAPQPGGEGKTKAKGIRGRILALFILLPLLAIGALAASYVGTQVLGETTAGAILGPVLALATGFLVAAAAIAAIFKIFPPEPLEGRQVLRGTVFTAAGISFLSLAFSLYLTLGADFQERYATSGVAAIVLVAVWLFGSNALLLVGYRMALRMPAHGSSMKRRKRGASARRTRTG